MNKTEIYKKIDEVCRVGYAKSGHESVIINQNDLWNLGDVLKEIVERLPSMNTRYELPRIQISCRTCIHRSPLDGPSPSKEICIECRRLKNFEKGDRA